MAKSVSALVSSKWLSKRLYDPGIRVLDGSWYFPSLNRDKEAEYRDSHIPNSLMFNIDDCRDKSSNFHHMLPSSQVFSEYVSELGIGNETHVIVYDNHEIGLFSAARVWWMFRVFGHKSVAVLDGGMGKWREEGRELTNRVPKFPAQKLTVEYQKHLVKGYEEILENVTTKKNSVVDTRSADRFFGRTSGHYKDIPPGRLPDSQNIPYRSIMDPCTRTMLPVPKLQHILREAGVSNTTVATCGTGVTSCMLALAAYQCGMEDVAVYDGSWQEWWNRAPEEYLIDCPHTTRPL